MTFSIVGRCDRTGEVGVAVTSSSPAVAARCAHTRAGVGAVATQNVTDPRLGPAVLDALASGLGAGDAVVAVVAVAPEPQFRQVTAVGADGSTGVFSGSRSLGVNGHVEGAGCVVAGNLLASLDVLTTVAEEFSRDPGADLADRLVAALEAGLAAGGEAGPLHSAGVQVSGQVAWPVTDLRVDWSDDPIGDLRRLLTLWAPQRADYVTRALDPASAPGFGVPGEAP